MRGSTTFDMCRNGTSRQKAGDVIGEAVAIKLEKVILVASYQDNGLNILKGKMSAPSRQCNDLSFRR